LCFILQRDANVLALSTLRFIREIVRPTDGALDGFSRNKLHDQLFDARNCLTTAEDQAIVLTLGHRSIFVRRRQQNGDHVTRRGLALDWMPARLLLAHLLDLLAHLLVGDLAGRTRDAKSLGAA
jgi:hypothetical protein